MRAVILFCSLVWVSFGWANEVDNFSHRWDEPPLSDAGPLLDARVNEQLQKVVDKYNSPLRKTFANLITSSKPCDSERLESILSEEFQSKKLMGAFEFDVEVSARIEAKGEGKKTRIEAHHTSDHNIYQHPDYGLSPNAKSEYFASAASYKIPLASSINLGGHYVGTDKLGHFFDQGWSFFNEYKREPVESQKTRRAVAEMLASEQGTYGLAGTGIYSFGDLSANLSGGLFWMAATRFDMSKAPSFIRTSPFAKKIWEQGPFFQCEDGKLALKRAFRWKDYVTDAWDEGINCVDFSPLYDEGLGSHPKLLFRNLKKLEEKKPGQRYQCPVQPGKCEGLKREYGSFLASRLLSSECGGVPKARHRFELKKEACWYARHYKSKLADFKCSDIPDEVTDVVSEANQ